MSVISATLKMKKSRKRTIRPHKYTRYEIHDPTGVIEGEVLVRKTIDKEDHELQLRDSVYLVVK